MQGTGRGLWLLIQGSNVHYKCDGTTANNASEIEKGLGLLMNL